MSLLLVFLSKYLIPGLFVIGLLYFLYGAIEYFIVGKGGDEGRAQHGRELFLKSIGWFALGLVAHLVVVLLSWLGTISLEAPSAPSGGGSVRPEPTGVLEIPNAPTR